MMKGKNKFLSLVLCFLSMFLAFVGFSACNKPEEGGGNQIVSTQKDKFEFSVNNKEVYIYSTYQLHLNKMEGVTYKSSNANVATVDANGVVYANGFGETTITATLGELQAQCVIKVVGQDILPSIQVSQDNASLVWSNKNQVGSTFDINPNIEFNGVSFNDGQFTFASSAPNVASVDASGKITAKGYGSAVISIQGSWRNRFDSAVLNKTIAVNVIPNASIELIPASSVISTVNRTIDGKVYSNQTTFTANVTLDGDAYNIHFAASDAERYLSLNTNADNAYFAVWLGYCDL